MSKKKDLFSHLIKNFRARLVSGSDGSSNTNNAIRMGFLSISRCRFLLNVSIFKRALSRATSTPGIHALLCNPSKEKHYMRVSEFTLIKQTCNLFSSLHQSPGPREFGALVHHPEPITETGGIWFSDWPACVSCLFWIGEWTPTGIAWQRREGYPQKETGVLLPKARGNKCKQANLLFAAYIVSWFCYERESCYWCQVILLIHHLRRLRIIDKFGHNAVTAHFRKPAPESTLYILITAWGTQRFSLGLSNV